MAIAIILGTRPEIIKMASVIRRPYRKLGMKVLDVATNVAGGVSFTDSQSGFRAYGRRAIESIYIKGSDMSAGSEVLLQAKDHDLRIKEVPIHCSYNVERASTQNPVSHGVKTLLMVLLTLVGAFMALTGIILHSISKMMNECKSEIEQIGRASNVYCHNTGNAARDN